MNGTAVTTAARAASLKWITGRNFDLFFYIGACLTGYLSVYAHVGLGVPAVLLWWFWILSVDGPHVFATVSRTYLDSQEWQRRAKLLLGSLLWFLLGPLSIFTGILTGSYFPYFLFLAFAAVWAYWHVVRQHYGFLVMYQKKNGEPAGRSNQVDYWCFYTLMLAPFISFILRHPEARERLALPVHAGSFETAIVNLLHALIVLSIIVYAGKEIMRFRSGDPFNVPKNLFLTACVPLHLFVFLHPYISTHLDILLFVVFVTFYHNIQYHGIVWFYNRNRYQASSEKKQFGPAAIVTRNFLIYYAAGIVFTFVYRYSNWYFMGLEVPLLSGPNAFSEIQIGPHFKVADLAFSFLWGFALNHYYLDQKIWKLSKDQRLNQELKITQPEKP